MKTRFLFTLPFFCFFSTLKAQKDSIPQNTVYILGNSGIGYATLNLLDPIAAAHDNIYVPHRQRSISPSYNYALGFGYQRILTKGLYLDIGFRYAMWGYDLDTTKPYNSTKSAENIQTQNTAYIELPIAVGYKFGRKNFHPYVLVGLSTMVLVKNYTSYSSQVASINLAPTLTFGASYRFHENWSVFAHYTSKIQLFSAIKSNAFEERLMQFGLAVGVSCRL